MEFFWRSVKEDLKAGYKMVFMYVLHSKGSSPGRQGFKMLVSDSGLIAGSIGGGIMEHKLVELCREELLKSAFRPFVKNQIHQDGIGAEKSGMVCSGEQTIAFYQLKESNLPMVSEILNAQLKGKYGVLYTNENEVSFFPAESLSKKFDLELSEPDKWLLKEDLGNFPVLHIVGGGHVGLALSKFANELGFAVVIYDDREGLNTIAQNQHARTILVEEYERIKDHLATDLNDYVVLMSFGYRTDKIILKQLLINSFKYFGMMGSNEKVKKLFNELHAEGIDKSLLAKVHAPIGIQISSKTPEEIAISILAEIIQVKNQY